jgi:hypothetical protein
MLGPRSDFNPHQVMFTALGPNEFQHSPTPSSSPSSFDTQVLLASLNIAAVAPQPTSDWFVNSGTSSHVSGTSLPLQFIKPFPYSPTIKVGNGAHLPVTHTGLSSIPTRFHSLLLRNILMSPDLVENLISVCKLTHDNLVSIEFGPFCFSIKDLHTRLEMLRCDSDGDLYPLTLQPSKALHATSTSIDLWHQRLKHPGRGCLLQVLRFFISVVISLKLTLVKPANLASMFTYLFHLLIAPVFFLSSLFTQMYGPHLFLAIRVINIT